eukprot:954175-Ditylum_brightwellii.AAC.1
MYDLGFKSCKADPDLLIEPGVKNDGTKYWEYVLIHVDNILCMSYAPGVVMECISKLYRSKLDLKTRKKYNELETYLSNDIGKFSFPEGGKPA